MITKSKGSLSNFHRSHVSTNTHLKLHTEKVSVHSYPCAHQCIWTAEGLLCPSIITIPLGGFWPWWVVLKTLICCPSGGGHCPASRWMLFAVHVFVCVSPAHIISYWKLASWQHLAAPAELLCENFLQSEDQTCCVIVVCVRHNLQQCVVIAARWRRISIFESFHKTKHFVSICSSGD